ncbi:MAG: hypothetical protein AAF799_06615 [Myxococcota bacterium]
MEPAVREVIDRAAARHGGWERWQNLESITLDVESLGGMVPWVKGLGRTFPQMGRCTVDPRRRVLTAHDFPSAGQSVVFERGRIVGEEPDDYRRRFDGLAKLRRWTPADATYFFGYALTHYLALPFSLADADVVEHRPRRGASGCDRLTVRYPPGAHTHGEIERFHFDATGLLVRHDYHAEILGPGTHGAHFSRDYVDVDGLPIARTRRVVMRLGSWATPIPVLTASLLPLECR